MADIKDPLKDIFLAGVGALAMGAEKSRDIISSLVDKGQLTVEQGKDIADGIGADAAKNISQIRDDIIVAHMKTMSKDERDEFAARIAELASQVDGDEELEAEERAEVQDME